MAADPSTPHRLAKALLVLAAVSCRAPAPPVQVAPAAPPVAEDFRAQVPASVPAAPLHLPEVRRRLMANGLQVLVTPKPGLPLVAAQLVVRSGSAQDPEDLPGLASFVAAMLRSGTHKRSAHAIAEQTENLGTSIDVSVDEDAMVVGFVCLREHFAELFDILADVCLHPRFAPDEVERKRRQLLGQIRQDEDEPTAAAASVFRRALYGHHPYAHPVLGDKAAAARIGRADLVGHWRTHVQPGNAALVFTGDLSEEQGWAAAQRGFGLWHGSARAQAAVADPQGAAPDLRLVDRPASTQSTLLVGVLGAHRQDPDFYPLIVLNSILGGSFNSRINMNLREDKGYTYGAFSHFRFPRSRGHFEVHTRVRSDVTAAALKEILAEVEGMRQRDASAGELADAKNRYVLSIPSSLQTVGSLAGQVTSLYVHDLPLDELAHLPERIGRVTVEDVRRLAHQILDPAQLQVVVVGDGASIRPALEQLGRGPVKLALPSGELAADALKRAPNAGADPADQRHPAGGAATGRARGR